MAVRIPRSLAEQLRLEQGSEVEITVAADRLTIRPRSRTYALEDLVARITPENRHDETDWGEPPGAESP